MNKPTRDGDIYRWSWNDKALKAKELSRQRG